MKTVSELFEISYGHSLELNRLTLLSREEGGIAFVSRKMGDNGIAAYVAPIQDLPPSQAGLLTCALGGNVLSTFLQEQPFYSGRDIALLRPLFPLTKQEQLFYCYCIFSNRYRFSYGRQANRTLKNILIPDLNEIPSWVSAVDAGQYDGYDAPDTPSSAMHLSLGASDWKCFTLADLFDIARGTGPRRQELNGMGSTPFVTSSDSNNGVTGVTSMQPTHQGNTIGVNRNGSVAEAFYQALPFCSTEDVHIFTPKFHLNPYIALFLTTVIRQEKYRFGYGRKWGIERMKKSIIKLPTTSAGTPDWVFMEHYIKSMPYSSQLR